jgi:universal stress protein A
MLPITKILCPTDFSEPSYKALETANELARHFNAEIILIHILSPVFVYPATALTPGITKISEISDVDRDEMAYKSLSMTLKEKVSDSIKSRSIMGKGNPAEEIARSAKEEKADLIVIGTHGFTGWRHLILGSVAEKVVRLANCPVITIPAHKTAVAM